MKDRILQIMQQEGMSNAEFAEKIGISTSSLSHIFNGRNKPSLEVVTRIHKAYPFVNLEWLLTGEGEMMGASEPLQAGENGEFPAVSSMEFDFRKDDSSNIVSGINQSAGKEEIRYIEKPHPKITEIRIFFDDNTFQVFRPENTE